MIDVRRIASVIALVLVSWLVLEGSNSVLGAIELWGILGLLLKCMAITVFGGGVGILVSKWALRDWSLIEAMPFAAVGPWVAVVHMVNYGLGGDMSLAVEVSVMTIGAFAVHGLLAGLALDAVEEIEAEQAEQTEE